MTVLKVAEYYGCPQMGQNILCSLRLSVCLRRVFAGICSLLIRLLRSASWKVHFCFCCYCFLTAILLL
jgi:hypothetical protein